MENYFSNDIFKFETMAQALSNVNRLKILDLLKSEELNINEISKKLNMPMPTVTVNIKKLEEAGIITCELKAGKHGKQKICSLKYREITLCFYEGQENQRVDLSPKGRDHMIAEGKLILPASDFTSTLFKKSFDIKLGDYSEYTVKPECGMASSSEILSENLAIFGSAEKTSAEVLWFNDGFLIYDIPISLESIRLKSLKISFEVCSQHMFFNHNWPTDLTLWLNDFELGTYTTEGYFGDRGRFTPSWWSMEKPQFGEQVTFEIDDKGTNINGFFSNSFTINDINTMGDPMKLKIGIKENAKNSRGIVLFGENFGSYKQNILIEGECFPKT